MSEKYICDECKFTRHPHEHKCYDRSTCQCDRCTIVDLYSENARLKDAIKALNECTCPSCGVQFIQQILSVKQAREEK